ncbi:MAG: Lrp/AsnC ligand binding domain-containing protein [Methanomassiliicoccaceae archaeon]|jgi:DNA-binding Lrp family transcriptional regulator|nr:Lrp/AsnC family transcriptional regulator [Euryarchaeota archaeon]HOB38063.1 Lrp/AsnC ligand binding domain-containing protein [Methanomassiliicoccaceae archaeon]HQD87846.1 Lrp/AsnC ligand binding domain-containing protein [Methanomassiliicoccaceae archaeon]
MPAAIVLVSCEVGKEDSVADELCQMQGVESVAIVYGVYDLVVKLSAETLEGLEGLIIKKLRTLSGIRATVTLMVSRECAI